MHELNFDMKRKLDGMLDEMAEQEKLHQTKVSELDSDITERIGINK